MSACANIVSDMIASVRPSVEGDLIFDGYCGVQESMIETLAGPLVQSLVSPRSLADVSPSLDN